MPHEPHEPPLAVTPAQMLDALQILEEAIAA
jgi:hypothetical protein